LVFLLNYFLSFFFHLRGYHVLIVTSKLKTTEVDTDTYSNLNTKEFGVNDMFLNRFNKDMIEFSKEGKWDSVYYLCKEFKKSNHKPNLSIYNTILRSYVPLGAIKNSLKILEDMRLADVKPNIVTYDHLLRVN